ncbi:MAG: hypothetical protein WBN77_18215 [Desulfobacterales bacterium]
MRKKPLMKSSKKQEDTHRLLSGKITAVLTESFVQKKHMIKINPLIPETKGAYIVGGSVRDLLIERTPSDYDIVVPGSPEKYASDLTSQIKGHIVKIGKQNQMIFRVISEKDIFDVSAISGNTIEDDLAKRDFTLNAICYDLYSKTTIDPFGGVKDLLSKKIRMVSDKVFNNDPVRLIRAYRIAAMLDFEIEYETEKVIADNVKLIAKSAAERVKVEIFKIFSTLNSYKYINKMYETGLLFEIFPELSPLSGCLQNKYHTHDVLNHSLIAYNKLEMLLNGYHADSEISGFAKQEMDNTRSAMLKCSILLHDTGKPSSITVDNDNVHFFGHEKLSADITLRIAARLKFSNHETKYIDYIIRNHMKALHLYESFQKKPLTDKSIIRFFVKCRDNIPDLLLHAIADMEGKRNSDNVKNMDFLNFVSFLIKKYNLLYKIRKKEPPLINGNDLISEFGLLPSPLFKKILNFVEEARLSDNIHSRSEALLLAKGFLENKA